MADEDSTSPAKGYRELPLVYACSGCSSAAQLANDMAVRLDHEQLAEMSCIAGVGGGVPGLVKVARSGRPILALDGCKLQCTRHCLAREGIVPTRHIDLSTCGVKKRFHALADEAERARIWSQMILPTLQILHETKK